MNDESNHKPYINTPESGVPAPFDPFEKEQTQYRVVVPYSFRPSRYERSQEYTDAELLAATEASPADENWNEIEPHLRKIGREAVRKEREKLGQ